MRNRYLVAYDISDDKRWRKVYRCMNGYGDPVQYSVFLCDLSERERVLMVGSLLSLINQREDRVMIVNLGPASGRGEKAIEFLGRSWPMPDRGPVVV
ncbi:MULTISPECIES: CRISPR-associated endonuclease Cas2 [Symbiobacterium]|uniref:CRISPR-associated endoribonuclease Cas2 n=1 Tax=Symbiobacterium thermophilum TaxID=2734 RepID=A0A953IDB1_SYMTR|nr:CRISPR-associated endonuclease Cas2 [Symbiobacterium thermophilum]MBY6277254.1 CRISPR-associated endonuclease Cas2 [Symbiobacterium thermophilum]